MVAIVCRGVAIAAFTMFPRRTDTCPFRIFLSVRFSIKASWQSARRSARLRPALAAVAQLRVHSRAAVPPPTLRMDRCDLDRQPLIALRPLGRRARLPRIEARPGDPTCQVDGDCNAGDFCLGGECRTPNCSSGADCPGGVCFRVCCYDLPEFVMVCP